MKAFIFLICAAMLGACAGAPEGVRPVADFQIERYLGKWYEIARLDHSFERGLQQVTAEYTLREDGGVSVLNRGYSAGDGQWQEAEGKAYFVKARDIGHLKVAFFGPFYGDYVIFELERDNYDYAFVAGPNRSYLWLLARTPQPPKAVIDRFVEQSTALGFDVEKLIYVDHSPAR